MKCAIMILPTVLIAILPLTSAGLFSSFGRSKKDSRSGDVVVISGGQSPQPIVFKGTQGGLNILMGGGGGGSIISAPNNDDNQQGGGGQQTLTSNGDLATSASEPELSMTSSPANAIAKTLTDLVTSESSQSTTRLSTPELFNKLMKMPASKFDKIADKLIQDALMGTANSILSSSSPSSSAGTVASPGSATSASSVSTRTVPFIPLQAGLQGRMGGLPSGLMSSFLPPSLKLPLMMAAAAASNHPVRVPIATIRLPVYVPDNDADDSYEEVQQQPRPSNGHRHTSSASNHHDNRQTSSSSGVNFDESKIPPPVRDSQQHHYDDSASFERPNYDQRPFYTNNNNNNYNDGYHSNSDRPRAEPYSSSSTHFDHTSSSSSDSPSDTSFPMTSAHSDHRNYNDDDGSDGKHMVHTYSSSGPSSDVSNDERSSSYAANINHGPPSGYSSSRPSMTSASNSYPLLPSYTQSLPFTSNMYPIPITALNSLSPHSIPIFGASSVMSSKSSSSANPFRHSSSHPLLHLNKLLHNGYVSDISKIPQPFTYNHNHGLSRGSTGSRGSLPSSDFEKLQATLASQMLSTSASTSTPTRTSRFLSRRPFSSFPSFRVPTIFGSSSILSKSFAKPPLSMATSNNPVSFGSTPLGQATRTFGSPPTVSSNSIGSMASASKTYPILDTSSSVPKVFHAPHNPVDILKIFADAYGKQGLPTSPTDSNKMYSARSLESSPSAQSSSPSLASTLFKTRNLFTRPLLTSRSGIEKSVQVGGPDLKAIVTILPTEATFPSSLSSSVDNKVTSSNNNNNNEDMLDTMATETRHFPIFVKADDTIKKRQDEEGRLE